MKKTNKSNWIKFVEDINNALKLDPPIPTDSEEDALEAILERQHTDDAFVDEDYLPQKGIGMQDSTVAWLIENDIPIPNNWKKRMEAQTKKAVKAAPKKVKKSPVKKLTKKVKEDPVDIPEEPEDETPEEAPAEPEVKATPETAKKTSEKKNALGHLKSTLSGKLDEMFLEGIAKSTLEEQGYDMVRVMNHFRHIRRDKSDIATAEIVDGVIKVTLK